MTPKVKRSRRADPAQLRCDANTYLRAQAVRFQTPQGGEKGRTTARGSFNPSILKYAHLLSKREFLNDFESTMSCLLPSKNNASTCLSALKHRAASRSLTKRSLSKSIWLKTTGPTLGTTPFCRNRLHSSFRESISALISASRACQSKSRKRRTKTAQPKTATEYITQRTTQNGVPG